VKTRKELDGEWLDAAFALRRGETPDLGALVREERAVVDRQVAAKAIRWAAKEREHVYPQAMGFLRELADRLESGEVEIE
jgi:hypothetical protein